MEKEKEKNPTCGTVKNATLITAVTAAVFVLVYLTIKEGQRIKVENELLEYDVW